MNSVATQQREGTYFHPQVLVEHAGFAWPGGHGEAPRGVQGCATIPEPFLRHPGAQWKEISLFYPSKAWLEAEPCTLSPQAGPQLIPDRSCWAGGVTSVCHSIEKSLLLPGRSQLSVQWLMCGEEDTCCASPLGPPSHPDSLELSLII